MIYDDIAYSCKLTAWELLGMGRNHERVPDFVSPVHVQDGQHFILFPSDELDMIYLKDHELH